ncbi:hypothetical protein SFC66_04160 [Terribacillus saccharophilus]|uniref:hypothetical protein n=1 Tax=Terribacillus saccharophilus TaxID=361277 RepID=UPI0039826A1C
MKAYLAKLGDAIDKNNITVDSYSSEQLTEHEFYKEFQLLSKGNKASTTDDPVPITKEEFDSLRDHFKDSKHVQDDHFEWNGEYITLDDGRIIKAHFDTETAQQAFEFVSHIPGERDLSEYAKEVDRKIIKDGTIGTVDYLLGGLLTMEDPSLGDVAMAIGSFYGKSGKAVKDGGIYTISSFSKYIDELAESMTKGKGLPDAKPVKVNEFKGSTKETAKVSGMPPIVQSRINIGNEGWNHVVDRHFSKKNASQFTISKDELRSLLSSKNVVASPVTRSIESADGTRYVREVTLDKSIGVDKFDDFNSTSTMTILVDKHGNLITATPGKIK